MTATESAQQRAAAFVERTSEHEWSELPAALRERLIDAAASFNRWVEEQRDVAHEPVPSDTPELPYPELDWLVDTVMVETTHNRMWRSAALGMHYQSPYPHDPRDVEVAVQLTRTISGDVVGEHPNLGTLRPPISYDSLLLTHITVTDVGPWKHHRTAGTGSERPSTPNDTNALAVGRDTPRHGQ